MSRYGRPRRPCAAWSNPDTGGTLAYVVLTPRPGETFTEFYILGPGGNASGFPRNLTVNETGSVIIGVVNHEAATVNYSVQVDLVGVRIVSNATPGVNETVEVNRTVIASNATAVADARTGRTPAASPLRTSASGRSSSSSSRTGSSPSRSANSTPT